MKFETSIYYNNYGVYKLLCGYNKIYNEKTNKSFEIRYKEYIWEIKF